MLLYIIYSQTGMESVSNNLISELQTAKSQIGGTTLVSLYIDPTQSL